MCKKVFIEHIQKGDRRFVSGCRPSSQYNLVHPFPWFVISATLLQTPRPPAFLPFQLISLPPFPPNSFHNVDRRPALIFFALKSPPLSKIYPSLPNPPASLHLPKHLPPSNLSFTSPLRIFVLSSPIIKMPLSDESSLVCPASDDEDGHDPIKFVLFHLTRIHLFTFSLPSRFLVPMRTRTFLLLKVLELQTSPSSQKPLSRIQMRRCFNPRSSRSSSELPTATVPLSMNSTALASTS